ncbi:MAG: phage major capsid protein [Pseudomonadota bacterium]|nr:phage major capsid protein [Pseudomonadota bacterium]
MKSKELRAKRAKLIEDARALISSDAPSAEDTAKFDAMMTEADGLKAQIDRIERADDLAAEQLESLRNAADRNGTGADEERDRVALVDSAFNTWMRRGASALNEAQRPIYTQCFEAPANGGTDSPAGWRLTPRPQAALGVGTDPGGGATVPQGFYDKLIDAQKAYGGMVDAAFVFDTAGGNALPIPTDNDTTNSGSILGENVQVGTQDNTFGAVTMNAYVYTSKLVLVSNQLLQDTAFNLDAWLSGKLGTRIARATNAHFTTGTGASQPGGVVTGSTLGYTAGNSTTSGETASITYDDLVELEHSVDPAYRKSARFMMSDAALKVIKKLKDGIGRPLWMAGLAVKEPDTINSFPYVINQDMAAPAASAKSVLFGDFSNYFIRRVAGVQILRLTERYADFNQVGFLAFQRWDGQLVDAGTHPIKYLQQSSS